MTNESPTRFSPEEERRLVSALNAEIRSEPKKTGPGRAIFDLPLVTWLGRVYRAYGRLEPASKVAAYLGVIEPQDEEVRIRRIVKGIHVSEREVEQALNRLAADGFIVLRPAIRVNAVRIRLSI
ncbi:hypothetical protein [uncultured Roseibium sp.]|uniref:hypothetical protein n=1 Tax=uncultured Roseibium sp. TaxID=1936171 RepID=UPI00321726FB